MNIGVQVEYPWSVGAAITYAFILLVLAVVAYLAFWRRDPRMRAKYEELNAALSDLQDVQTTVENVNARLEVLAERAQVASSQLAALKKDADSAGWVSNVQAASFTLIGFLAAVPIGLGAEWILTGRGRWADISGVGRGAAVILPSLLSIVVIALLTHGYCERSKVAAAAESPKSPAPQLSNGSGPPDGGQSTAEPAIVVPS